MTKVVTRLVQITKTDAAKQIVYGEVYAPHVMDTDGEFMFPEDIESMAHDFLRLKLDDVIDTNHDKVSNGCFPVESFIAREGDPDYTPGAWVLGVKCTDDMWAKVQSGEINSFSFEAMTTPVECEVEIETFRDHFGETQKAGVEEHDHFFFCHVNESGRVTKGWTSKADDGHWHEIRGGSKTMTSGLDLHAHRYAL